MMPEELKLEKFLNLKRLGDLDKVSRLKSTLNNFALFATAIENSLAEYALKNGVKGKFVTELHDNRNAVLWENRAFLIRVYYSTIQGIADQIAVFIFEKGPLIEFLRVNSPPSSVLKLEKEGPPYFTQIYFDELALIGRQIEQSPVPDEWYLGVDL